MHVFPRLTRKHFCGFLAADLVPYIDTESSRYVPSSSRLLSSLQSSTNTGDVLGALKYARATFAMMCLVLPFLDSPAAALLTMHLSISIGSVYLLNFLATSRLRYLGFASSCLLVSIHLTLIVIFSYPMIARHPSHYLLHVDAYHDTVIRHQGTCHKRHTTNTNTLTSRAAPLPITFLLFETTPWVLNSIGFPTRQAKRTCRNKKQPKVGERESPRGSKITAGSGKTWPRPMTASN